MDEKIISRLAEPGAAYRAKPFWSWNGDLEEKELLRQIDALKEMGFGGYFMHSRTGLITEYLGEKWFSLIRACAEYGEKQGMESWIYDEDRWPSGTCGGLVTQNKAYRLRFLSEYDSDAEALSCPEVQKVVKRYALLLEGNILKDAKEIASEKDVPAGYRYACYAEECMKESEFYNGAAYLDTMNGEAVEAFLRSTLDVYAEKCGKLLGKEIRGVFTDEPHRGALFNGFGITNANRARMIPYTGALFEKYRKKYGESLCVPEIYYLRAQDAENETARRYIDVLDDLFTQNFAMPYEKWCKEHGIILTGHILHEDNLSIQTSLSGSMMRFYEYMDYPGIDNLSAHNACYWAAIQCASAARQTGKPFVLSELYGCTGWDMPLSEYKRIGDWQVLFGINLRCPHLSWYTMKGEAKRDYPASILDQNAWYKDWKLLEDYFARAGMILSEGERRADLLVVHPVENMWKYVHKGWMEVFSPNDERIAALDEAFVSQCKRLVGSCREFDYGDEELMEKYGSTGKDGQGAYLKVGKAVYRTVLLAEGQEVRASTRRLLEEFAALGGQVVGDEALLPAAPVTAPEGVAAAVRVFEGDVWLFLLNLEDKASEGEVTCAAFGEYGYAEEWDLAALKNCGDVSLKKMAFAPGQMRVLRLKKQAGAVRTRKAGEEVKLPARMPYELSEPNVLVLDKAVCTADGEVLAGGEETEVLKIDRALRERFGLTLRGGEMVQPWFAAKYAPETDRVCGKIKLVHRFTSEIECDCTLAAEYDGVTANGVPASRTQGRWVDNCFRLFRVHVNKGENEICAELDFKRSDNIEAMYLLGDFGVRLPATLVSLPDTLPAEEIGECGFPFYSGAITYRTGIGGKLRVRAEKLNGVSLHLSGKEEKVLAFPPYEAETETDDLALKIYFTRRNTFGPLHLTPQPQSAYGPDSFVSQGENWTEDYMLVPQGFSVRVEKIG